MKTFLQNKIKRILINLNNKFPCNSKKMKEEISQTSLTTQTSQSIKTIQTNQAN